MSERSAVQNPMLKYAQEIGWEYVPPDDALSARRREWNVFHPTLERQLLRLNPNIVDAAHCANILRQLNLLKPNIERKVKTFFDQSRFLRVLRDYIIFSLARPRITSLHQRLSTACGVARVGTRVV